ncbi:restriction endonuclease [Orenia marismortui]|uniref:restriction endonuclease n=1 Tax=Orenia marismortui TaxID=46469 RepID=UPI00038217D6|nr:restriction endonuclease [Orenia marismortui]
MNVSIDRVEKGINNRFQNLDGYEFEDFIADLFDNKGYYAFSTKSSSDFGVDVLASKPGERIAIQCKRYKYNNSTGIKAIQEVVSGKPYYKADKTIVITTSYFTKSAKELAEIHSVELWDWNILKKEVIEEYLTKFKSKKEMEQYIKPKTLGNYIDDILFKVAVFVIIIVLFAAAI